MRCNSLTVKIITLILQQDKWIVLLRHAYMLLSARTYSAHTLLSACTYSAHTCYCLHARTVHTHVTVCTHVQCTHMYTLHTTHQTSHQLVPQILPRGCPCAQMTSINRKVKHHLQWPMVSCVPKVHSVCSYKQNIAVKTFMYCRAPNISTPKKVCFQNTCVCYNANSHN